MDSTQPPVSASASDEPEFDYGYNPCPISSLQEGVGFIALGEMIIYVVACYGTGTLALSTEDEDLKNFYIYLFLIFFLTGATFPLLSFASFKRKYWILCIPTCVTLCLAFVGRIALIMLFNRVDPIGRMSGVLSFFEIYSFVVIVSYIVDVRKRPGGPPQVPELFTDYLLENAASPYGEQILSTDCFAASVRKNPRFQNGFP